MSLHSNPLGEGPDNALEHAVSVRDRDVLRLVRQAVERRQIVLAFQPVVQAARPGNVAFHEALLRVLDGGNRVIPARDFIAAVEESETGRVLDCIALEKGLAELSAVPSLRLSINMSARSIGYRRWMRLLTRALERDPTIAERLILEITETSAMLVPELVGPFMRDLRRRGVAFALDDFGAGYTAFRYFRDFQFDVLKIDGMFIRNIARDPDNQVLARAMVAIAQQFDMFTVAEKVETAEDARYLTQIGVDCLQGYHFGAPALTPPWAADVGATPRKSA